MPSEGDKNQETVLLLRDTSEGISTLTTLSTDTSFPLPALISSAGHSAHRRFLEFFTAHIRNRNTRLAYARAVGDFFAWCELRGLVELARIEPTHVGAYMEELGRTHAAPSVKQHLAAF
jgi:integrase/recombinase XerD